MAAAVADLEPCVRRPRCSGYGPNRGFGKAELPREHGGPLLQIAVVQPEIHFGQLSCDLRVVTPHETPGDKPAATLGQILDVGDGSAIVRTDSSVAGWIKGTGRLMNMLSGLIRRPTGTSATPGTEKTLSVRPVRRGL